MDALTRWQAKSQLAWQRAEDRYRPERIGTSANPSRAEVHTTYDDEAQPFASTFKGIIPPLPLSFAHMVHDVRQNREHLYRASFYSRERRQPSLRSKEPGSIYLGQPMLLRSDFLPVPRKQRKKETRKRKRSSKTSNGRDDESANATSDEEEEEQLDKTSAQEEAKMVEQRRTKTREAIEEIHRSMPASTLLDAIQCQASDHYNQRHMLLPRVSAQKDGSVEAHDTLNRGMLRSFEGNALVAIGVFLEELVKYEVSGSQKTPTASRASADRRTSSEHSLSDDDDGNEDVEQLLLANWAETEGLQSDNVDHTVDANISRYSSESTSEGSRSKSPADNVGDESTAHIDRMLVHDAAGTARSDDAASNDSSTQETSNSEHDSSTGEDQSDSDGKVSSDNDTNDDDDNDNDDESS